MKKHENFQENIKKQQILAIIDKNAKNRLSGSGELQKFWGKLMQKKTSFAGRLQRMLF